MSSASRVLLGLGAGLAIGIAFAAIEHPSLPGVVTVVEPLGTLWLNALRMTVVLLVVSLLIIGIAAASDIFCTFHEKPTVSSDYREQR